jgi:DNA-binding FadR family transcriptional regulator
MQSFLLPTIESLPDAPSVADALAAVIRDEIGKGHTPAGARLPAEHELMAHFAVSRPTCREALRILQSEGLIRVTRGKQGGARVVIPEPHRLARYAKLPLRLRKATLMDTLETRVVIETAVVERLARRPDHTVIERLAQIAISQRFNGDKREQVVERELAFRHLLLDSCENESLRLVGLMLDELISEQLQEIARRVSPGDREASDLRYMVDTKLNVLARIEAKDGARAARIWHHYLHNYMSAAFEYIGPELL